MTPGMVKGWTTTSQTLEVDGRHVTLESRAYQAGRRPGGFVWNRPAAVRVRGAGGDTRLPIHDLTRRGQVILYSISLVLIVAGLVWRGRSVPE